MRRQDVGKCMSSYKGTGCDNTKAVVIESRTEFGQGIIERPIAIRHDSHGQSPFADEFFLIRRQNLIGQFPGIRRTADDDQVACRKSTDPFAFFRQIQGNGPARYLKEPRRFGSSLTDEAFRIACRAKIDSIHMLDVHKNHLRYTKHDASFLSPIIYPKRTVSQSFFMLL